MSCPLSCLMHPDNVPHICRPCPGAGCTLRSHHPDSQRPGDVRPVPALLPPGPAGLSNLLIFPSIFKRSSVSVLRSCRLLPPVSVRELGQLSQDLAALLSGMFRRLGSQLQASGSADRDQSMYLFPFTFTVSSPAPLVAVVSPVQLTSACVSLTRTPPHSPDLIREASPS